MKMCPLSRRCAQRKENRGPRHALRMFVRNYIAFVDNFEMVPNVLQTPASCVCVLVGGWVSEVAHGNSEFTPWKVWKSQPFTSSVGTKYFVSTSCVSGAIARDQATLASELRGTLSFFS